MKHLIAAVLLILAPLTAARAQEAEWPRQIEKPGGVLTYYQPQVEEWKGFTDLTFRAAFALTPTSGKEVVGVVDVRARTVVDNDDKTVMISDLKVTRTHFPSLDEVGAAKMDALVRTFMPGSVSMSLYQLVASVQKPAEVKGVPLKNDPPRIFVSYGPTILLATDGKVAFAKIPNTKLEFVVNTIWPLFFDRTAYSYYLLIGQQWMTAKPLGAWTAATTLPPDLSIVAEDPQWAALKSVIPPPTSEGALPKVLYSSTPAEIILFEGKPAYAQIEGTQLLYSTNTSGYVFLHTAENEYYYLAAGRWFRAPSLQGPWTFATADLPADFAQIPEDSPAAVVLSSVPGTDEANDAVQLAQIPTTMTVAPDAGANVQVTYGGDPHFEPISGTPLTYATNTQDKVIKSGDVYYLCLQGVWFMSTTAQGPWTVANSVPQVIYTIPPSAPVYNVTYVTQTTAPSGAVESSYTAGYFGAFIVGATVGAIIANGSGYYYPPYYYHPPHGYPGYYPHPHPYGAYGRVEHYNSATGAYGVSHYVAGPYGTATRGAAYNPYTGTSARGASVATPYGSRSAAQAYNPYTGSYARTRQGSSPTAQWGSSVVTKGNQAALTQHYSTSQGTIASARTAAGGKALGTSTINGRSGVAKTAGGDMYASRDGNVYRNTGSGWQSYNGGNWNNVNTPPPVAAQQKAKPYTQPAAANQRTALAKQPATQPQAQSVRQPAAASAGNYGRTGAAPSADVQSLQREAQNRQRGAQQTQRFAQSAGSGSRVGVRRR